MLVKGSVKNLRGEPIPNCLIETWETDNDGFYDTQYAEYDVDCRGRLRTDAKGEYVFRAVLPVAYPIPNDGPVGKWLRSMNRHVFRPAHLHMMLQAQGYEELVTSLYFKGDVFLTSDAVFGVKGSLVKEPRSSRTRPRPRSTASSRRPSTSSSRTLCCLPRTGQG
jgi:protocatechuate 3,4-dioxygenase beta subunit